MFGKYTYKNDNSVIICSYFTSLRPVCMKIKTLGKDTGTQGRKVRDKKIKPHYLRDEKILTGLLYTCAQSGPRPG